MPKKPKSARRRKNASMDGEGDGDVQVDIDVVSNNKELETNLVV